MSEREGRGYCGGFEGFSDDLVFFNRSRKMGIVNYEKNKQIVYEIQFGKYNGFS